MPSTAVGCMPCMIPGTYVRYQVLIRTYEFTQIRAHPFMIPHYRIRIVGGLSLLRHDQQPREAASPTLFLQASVEVIEVARCETHDAIGVVSAALRRRAGGGLPKTRFVERSKSHRFKFLYSNGIATRGQQPWFGNTSSRSITSCTLYFISGSEQKEGAVGVRSDWTHHQHVQRKRYSRKLVPISFPARDEKRGRLQSRPQAGGICTASKFLRLC